MKPQKVRGNNTITGVRDLQPDETKEWFKCSYVITIDNGKPGAMGDGRIKVWMDKKAWLADEPATAMMNKARSAIHVRAKEQGIDLRSGFASFIMKYSWP